MKECCKRYVNANSSGVAMYADTNGTGMNPARCYTGLAWNYCPECGADIKEGRIRASERLRCCEAIDRKAHNELNPDKVAGLKLAKEIIERYWLDD